MGYAGALLRTQEKDVLFAVSNRAENPHPRPNRCSVENKSQSLLSLIVPCYNEEDVIGYTIPRLVQAFEQRGYPLEVVACDNGSSDRTHELLLGFVEQGYPIVLKRIKVNRGYGNGVLESVPSCSGTWIGIIPADGQVDAEDVVRVYESVARSDGHVLAKVRRRFRLDGAWRSVVSAFYNVLMHMLWPRIGSNDVNGSPKVLHRDVLLAMKLESRDWLLDPEMMIKASYMGVSVVEMNAFSRMREHGTSNVQPTTVWAFLSSLVRFRFGSSIRNWRNDYRRSGQLPKGARLVEKPSGGRPD